MVLVLHCSILCDHCSLVLFLFLFFFFFFLGFALHNIHAFHSRYNNNTKKKEKKEANFVLYYSSWFLRTRLVNLFSHNMFFVPCLALMSLLIALY